MQKHSTVAEFRKLYLQGKCLIGGKYNKMSWSGSDHKLVLANIGALNVEEKRL